MKLAFVFINLFFVASAFAETQLKLTGSGVSVPLSSLEANQTLSFYVVSKGKHTAPIQLSLSGPDGMKVTSSAAKEKGDTAKTLQNKSLFYPLEVKGQAKIQAMKSQCVDYALSEIEDEEEFNPNSIVPQWHPICELYSAEDLGELGAQLTTLYGGAWETLRTCGYLVYMYQGGIDGEGFPVEGLKFSSSIVVAKNYLIVVRKDACGDSKDNYVVKINVKMPKEFSNEGYLTVRAMQQKHMGGKEATIKPISEGKFAPNPLLLMRYLSFCGQNINVVKFKAGKPKSVKKVQVEDLIYYRDMTLTRSPIQKHLSGGKGSVELYNDKTGYGVCFELVRKRQRKNGYPS
jgi:hypothetical protein